MRWFLVSALVLCSCTSAKGPPGLDEAVAGVTLAAQALHMADGVCAGVAKQMRENLDPEGAAQVSGACAKVLTDAFDGLLLAADAIDAGKAVAAVDVACSVAGAARAALEVSKIVKDHGGKPGPFVDQFLIFSTPLAALCQEGVSK